MDQQRLRFLNNLKFFTCLIEKNGTCCETFMFDSTRLETAHTWVIMESTLNNGGSDWENLVFLEPSLFDCSLTDLIAQSMRGVFPHGEYFIKWWAKIVFHLFGVSWMGKEVLYNLVRWDESIFFLFLIF